MEFGPKPKPHSPVVQFIRDGNNKSDDGNNESNPKYGRKFLFGAAVAGFLGYQLLDSKYRVYNAKKPGPGEYIDNLRCYTIQEIAEHKTKETGIWVIYKEGVYDVTEYIDKHPGGEIILAAAGTSMEPFWARHPGHTSCHVFKMMENMRIGNVKKGENIDFMKDVEDPYRDEPIRHPDLHAVTKKPFNGSPCLPLLRQCFITPNEIHYVRNHLPVPNIDPTDYSIEIEIEGRPNTITLTMDDIKKFPEHKIMVTMMCQGSRRVEMSNFKRIYGLLWDNGAVSNAVWTGVRLSDVLKSFCVSDEDPKWKHVQFLGNDSQVNGEPFGGSIPIWRALDKRCDVLLAYEMNGVPLPRDHGFPLRVIAPGVAGARSVKWLAKIMVTEKENDSHWMQREYKAFSPTTDSSNVDWYSVPPTQELPVNSAICIPSQNEEVTVVNGCITVKGYAWSGGGQKILRVDVTTDGGEHWYAADVEYQSCATPPQHWPWTFWTATVPVCRTAKEVEIWAKAVDSSGNTQPESYKNIWNFRGIYVNAYHRVSVKLKRNRLDRGDRPTKP